MNRDDFLEIVYDELRDDSTNDRANRIIDAFDSVDAVRVVRCKDCKRHEDEEPGMVYCQLQIGGWISENWFCADGERKEE